MFFQPKFYRGKAVPPHIQTSGQPPSATPPSRGRIGSVPMLSTETPGGIRGVGTDREGEMRRPSLPEYNTGSRPAYFDSRYTERSQPVSPILEPIGFSPPRAKSRPLPPAPTPTLDTPSPPPLYHNPRTPSQKNHSTTPSLGSLSSSSTASYASESLQTPVKAYLHPRGPLSPSANPPCRPLPPPPAIAPDSPYSSRTNSPCPSSRRIQVKPRSSPSPSSSSSSRRSLRTPPPPPASASMYASMPLPPIPTLPLIFQRSGSAASNTGNTQKRDKRDSQATVRPGDIRRQRETRETMRPSQTLPKIIIEDPIDLYADRRVSGLSIQGDFDVDLDMKDIRSALEAFPVPPSHRPSSPSRYTPPRPNTALGQCAHLSAPTASKKDHRQSSKSTIRPDQSRKIPPPPIPALQFDLFSINDDMPDAVVTERRSSEKDIRVVSEAEEIRQRYLRGRKAAF